MGNRLLSHGLGLIGGVIGGVLGYFAVGWVLSQGFYGMMIPGALIGLGCSLLARHRSVARGVVCGVAALVFGLYCEWHYFPFKADPGLRYFLAHLFDLRPLTLIMIGFGGFFGFWMGKDASVFASSPNDAVGSSPDEPRSRSLRTTATPRKDAAGSSPDEG